MVDYVGHIKRMIEEYEKEYHELKKAVEVMKRAGEDTTGLELKLESIRSTLERWKNAIKEIEK